MEIVEKSRTKWKLGLRKEFEEQFPSLKGEGFCYHCESNKCEHRKEYNEREIKQFCIDKQRVREAIDKETERHLGYSEERSITVNNFVMMLKKRLGL